LNQKIAKVIVRAVTTLVIGSALFFYVPRQNNVPIQHGTVTVRGRQICLEKPGTGPQTLECALGLRATNGKDYALSDPSTDYHLTVQINDGGKFEVTGELTPPANNNYISAGTIKLQSVKRVGD
jgi:hypothetical protein